MSKSFQECNSHIDPTVIGDHVVLLSAAVISDFAPFLNFVNIFKNFLGHTEVVSN